MKTIDYIKQMIERAEENIIDDVYTHDAQKEKLQEVKNADIEIVVRCKDCKWYDDEAIESLSTCRLPTRLIIKLKENDYCSYGERKEEW